MSENQGEYKTKFSGFQPPESNFSKLPHELINMLPVFESMSELKVVLYTLRHTWGFSEFGKPKKITTDEYMNGRKKRDGTRLDNGTGLSNNSVISGLEKAVEHGFIYVEIDERDMARIEKSYCLNVCNLDVQELHSGMQDSHSRPPKVAQRSEKETKERKKDSLSTPDFKNLSIEEAYKIPTLKMYRKATGFFPGQVVWEYIHNFITEYKLTEEKIRQAAVLWSARGHRTQNVEGILEWARDGVPQKTIRVGGKLTSNTSVSDNWLAKKQAQKEVINGN